MEILAWTMLGLAFLLNPLTYLAGSAMASFLWRHLHPLTAAAVLLAFTGTSYAKTFDEMETEAINHGYNTAALVTCGDRLIVTNTKLRAKLDKMYRDNPKWKKAYLEGFESGSPPDGPSKTKATEARNRVIVCTIAGNSEAGWLKLDETRSLEAEELYRH